MIPLTVLQGHLSALRERAGAGRGLDSPASVNAPSAILLPSASARFSTRPPRAASQARAANTRSSSTAPASTT